MADTRPTSLRRSRSVGDAPITQSNGLVAESSNNGAKELPAIVVTAPETRISGPHSAGPSYSFHAALPPQSIPENSTHSSTRNSIRLPSSPPAAALHPPGRSPVSTVPSLPTTHDRPPVRPYQPPRSMFARILLFLGYGRDASRTRRLLVSLVWNISWGLVQIVAIIAVLASSAPKPSPTKPGLNEWTACDRPLGAWLCLWIARVLLASGLAYWGWARDRVSLVTRLNRSDAERGTSNLSTNRPSRTIPSRTPNGYTNTRNNRPELSPSSTESSDQPPLPHTQVYRRLSLLSSLMSLTWFLTAHILVYTSINTCRFDAPHIWWLTFAILCITYLVILEVLVLGLVVFVIAPVLFLIWNIFLICIGRHPLQNPHMIKPEIGKLPKSVVDRIPLVMYIPPPPDAAPSEGPMKIPDIAYSYPPKPQTPAPSASRRRFRFIRKFSKPKHKGGEGTNEKNNQETGDGLSLTWEDNWEKEGYPFVVLEGNRAACAICLMDFEEPKRTHPLPNDKNKAAVTVGEVTASDAEIQPQAEGNITEEQRQLQLEDVGEGAQPLRLLTCGHVFHKTCLDPWLIDVSGRCPTCQRPVEVPEPPKKKKSNR